MPSELVRLVTASGATFISPVTNLTPHSVFVAGANNLVFGDLVRMEIFEMSADARVIFTSKDPLGVVVSFQAPKELARRISVRQGLSVDPWEEPTREHSTKEFSMLADAFDRANTITAARLGSNSEDPTNTGTTPLKPSMSTDAKKEQPKDASSNKDDPGNNKKS